MTKPLLTFLRICIFHHLKYCTFVLNKLCLRLLYFQEIEFCKSCLFNQKKISILYCFLYLLVKLHWRYLIANYIQFFRQIDHKKTINSITAKKERMRLKIIASYFSAICLYYMNPEYLGRQLSLSSKKF